MLTPTAAGMLADDQPAGEATEPPAKLSIVTRIGSHQMRSSRALVLAGQRRCRVQGLTIALKYCMETLRSSHFKHKSLSSLSRL